MHTMGGCFVGFLGIYLLYYKSENTEVSLKKILQILLFVLIVGILWEVFELCFYNLLARNSFNVLDTTSDIFFDLSGGILAILYYSKQILLNVQNKVE
jgi:hypothetical protein